MPLASPSQGDTLLKKTVLCVAIVLALVPSRSHAQPFAVLGARPLGMGGAFVAVADNALAQYWNPAGLGPQTNFDLQVPVNTKVEFTGGVLSDINNISNAANDFSRLQTAQNGTTTGAKQFDAKSLNSFLSDLSNIVDINQPGKGALADLDGGVNLRIGRVAVSVNYLGDVGVVPHADVSNFSLSGISVSASGATLSDSTLSSAASALATVVANTRAAYPNVTGTSQEIANVLINNAQNNGASNADIVSAVNSASQNSSGQSVAGSASGSFSNNSSNIQLKGGSFTEAAVGYAHTLFLKDLYLGGNLKIISGQVGFYQQNILQNSTNSSDASKSFFNNSKTTVKPSIDLGLLYDKRKEWRTRLGLVAKDLNNPSFDQPQAGMNAGLNPIKLNPQVRAGAAVYPLDFWTVAMDIDVTKNLTQVDGFTSQMFGLGTEINVFNKPWLNIPLRAGLMKNIAESSSKLSYTGGIGLNFLHVIFELAGAVSSQTVNVSNSSSPQNVPTNISIGATLSVIFGGHKE
jgi:hypothetical protein